MSTNKCIKRQAHQNLDQGINSHSMHTFQGINDTHSFNKLGCFLIYFPCHPCHYWEWFNIDSTCDVPACVLLKTLQAKPDSVVSVWDITRKHTSAVSAGVKATEPPWETSMSWWDGQGNPLMLGILAGQHEMEIFSKMLLGRQVCDCTSVSAPWCLHSSSVYVSLLPPHSWVKKSPIAKTNKQTTIPHCYVFRFISVVNHFWNSALNWYLQYQPK